MNLIEQAKQYAEGIKTLTAWLGAGAVTVDPRTSQDRADVCLKCPQNVEVKLIESIASAIKRQVELKNKLGLRVNGEKSLHTCSGCGCALRLRIHVPIQSLGLDEEELNRFDSACWMRKEFNQLKKT